MRTLKLAGVALAVVISLCGLKGLAEDTLSNTMSHAMPPMPQPTTQHQWIQQLAGEWTSENHMVMEPGQPAVVSNGWETVRKIGPFWTVSEVRATMMDQPFTGNFTLGYDDKKDKFVGTWVDSVTGQLVEYEGTLNPAGDTLTMEGEGFCPMMNRNVKVREEVMVKDPYHKVYKSWMQDEQGNWVNMMTSYSTRQK